jgi:hypothetical protein
MNAIPPSSFGTDAERLACEPGTAGEHWAALAEAAQLVAALARIPPEPVAEGNGTFLLQLSRAEAWRREHAERGVADLVAIMEPGIAALLAVNARGADPRPAARALWHEFTTARAAILALLPPCG